MTSKSVILPPIDGNVTPTPKIAAQAPNLATLMADSPVRHNRSRKAMQNQRNLSLALQSPFQLQTSAALNAGRKSTSNIIAMKSPFDKGCKSGKKSASKLETFDDDFNQ